MTTDAQRQPAVGFIGLGIMGKPMAKNLLAAGYPLVVLNRSRGPVDELVALGATAGTTPSDVAARSDVVITMLPDSPDVESVALGDDGIAAGVRDGALWIDMSTIAPATTKRVAGQLAAKGVESLDAPVSGGEKGAIDPGFKSKLHRKDMNIAANAGDDRDLDLAAAKLVCERFDTLIARGGGDRDHSALFTLYTNAVPAST
jgi:3-hydroxyisobutyrate dehydrogenase-like beta-hydroxyacid dehydrogenase